MNVCNCNVTHTEIKIPLQQLCIAKRRRENLGDKWSDAVTHALKDGDTVDSMWPGTYDGAFGHIILSQERLLFVEEHGFHDQIAQIILNLPYNIIRNAVFQSDQQLILTSMDGERRYIASPHLSLFKHYLDLHLQQTKSRVSETPTA